MFFDDVMLIKYNIFNKKVNVIYYSPRKKYNPPEIIHIFQLSYTCIYKILIDCNKKTVILSKLGTNCDYKNVLPWNLPQTGSFAAAPYIIGVGHWHVVNFNIGL